MENILNLIFPPKCAFCTCPDTQIICTNCLENCKKIYINNCIVCDTPSILGTTHLKCLTATTPISTLSIFEYAHNVRKCIREAKYKSRQFMVLKYLTQYGSTKIRESGFKLTQASVIVPIPLSKQKERDRGFNQANIIARIIAKKFNVALETNILKRQKTTVAQHSQSKKDRYKNLDGAFTISLWQKNTIKGQKILLIDDILTSGATLREAAKTLYLAEAREVHCFTLAKALKHRYNQRDA